MRMHAQTAPDSLMCMQKETIMLVQVLGVPNIQRD